MSYPYTIRVKVKRNNKTGVYLAELPEYDIFTEADSFTDLVFHVNDLVHTYFDIPKKLRDQIWYMPPKISVKTEQSLPTNPILFHVLTSCNSLPGLNGNI